MPGLAGLSCRSKAVVLTAFCSSPVSLARLPVKVSAMRNSIDDRPMNAARMSARRTALLSRPDWCAPPDTCAPFGRLRRAVLRLLQSTLVYGFTRYKCRSYLEHLHHLVAQVVDHLHRDAAGHRLVVEAPRIAVQCRPGFRVDLRLQRGLGPAIRGVAAVEVGWAGEEAAFRVIRCDGSTRE